MQEMRSVSMKMNPRMAYDCEGSNQCSCDAIFINAMLRAQRIPRTVPGESGEMRFWDEMDVGVDD